MTGRDLLVLMDVVVATELLIDVVVIVIGIVIILTI